MPNISTLVADIYSIAGKVPLDVSVKLEPQQPKGKLRLSQMKEQCPRALWYSIHHPELAEPLPPYALIKYNYGHFIEAMAIAYAKAAGHEVVGEQDAIILDGVEGHRDCVIDGCIVDVKSTSSLGFKKFKTGSIEEDDPFGYLDQLDGYVVGSADDPCVTCKDRGYLLAIDKQLGHICLYEHRVRPDRITKRIAECKRIVGCDIPPECTCKSIPDGKSGNFKLDTQASYSAYKYACKPLLRTFLYASGPVYLTRVERKPDVPEIDKNGKIVYH